MTFVVYHRIKVVYHKSQLLQENMIEYLKNKVRAWNGF